ncbi:10889_t:CDS:1 [Paraglomus brasilianum]|uniref:10889_t:CDS:1 n=1 Tax=Paraglomus brasilianum TaxID=144538 RepID=A0A9N9D2H1_9GLOM|nr:10889_t:CDS:1 [Paraglomus brasilianum]
MEDMIHWGIDSLIRVPLQIFRESLGGGALPIEMDRNSKDKGTMMIGNKRPDFLCWVNGVLLFKGKEKAEADDFPVAVDELKEKFNKFDPLYFGNVQFMICYTVAGLLLGFYVINGLPNSNPLNHLVPLSNQLNIKNSRDRVSILCMVVNIACIIRTVSSTIPRTIVPIGKQLKLAKSTITFFEDSVEKMVPLEHLPYEGDVNDCVAFLQQMYNCAKGHPGLIIIQVKEGRGPKIKNQGIYRVVFETQGQNF